jgi:hypothetical protein
MQKRLGQKLNSLAGLMLFGFVVFLGFYHISQRYASELSVHNMMRTKDRPDTFYNERLSSEPARGRYVFHLNQSQSIGKVDLVYRGLAGGSEFLIDVVIPELDPQRPYKYRLDIDTAENGFRLAGYDFRLDSVGAEYVRLVRERPLSK